MSSTDLVLWNPSPAYAKPEPFKGVKNALAALTDSYKRAIHARKYRPQKSHDPKMLVIIPAHNEADGIAATITALLNQTRKADRIVVVADNCTDNTVAIARRFQGVSVMETVNNNERKVGALTQAWRRWGAGYDYICGTDADTILERNCLAQLEAEMQKDKKIGGVCARFTFDQNQADSPMTSALVRLQRIEFSEWVSEIGHRKRSAYVLGGQCTMFRNSALMYIADHSRRGSPWDSSSMVEDAATSIELQQARYKTMMSHSARAYAGAMPSLRALWAQRLKWEQGGVRLMLDNGYKGSVKTRWHQQIGLFMDLMNRVLFLLLFSAAISQGKFTFSPWWVIPPVLSIFVNLRAVWKTPHRKPMDVVFALLVFPAELYLLFQLAVGVVSWAHVLVGAERNGWENQYRAEKGNSGNLGKIFLAVVGVGAFLYSVSIGWTYVNSDMQDKLLTAGWILVAGVTLTNCARMLFKLLRPARGFRP